MKGVDTLHIKPATKAYNKINTLGFSHLTTLDIGQIVPLMAVETIQGGKYNVPSHHFMRTAPLVKPTYGNFSFRTVAGFVPFSQVAYDAEAFIDGKNVFEGATPTGRVMAVSEFVTYLVSTNLYGVTQNAGNTNYDFTYVAGNGTRAYRLLTPYGKYVYKVLCALGYTFPQNVDLQTGSTWMTNIGNWRLNMYPFFALRSCIMTI